MAFLCPAGGMSYFFRIIGIPLSNYVVSYILRSVQGVLVQLSAGTLNSPFWNLWYFLHDSICRNNSYNRPD